MDTLIDFGVPADKASFALNKFGHNAERALEWCFGDGENWTPSSETLPPRLPDRPLNQRTNSPVVGPHQPSKNVSFFETGSDDGDRFNPVDVSDDQVPPLYPLGSTASGPQSTEDDDLKRAMELSLAESGGGPPSSSNANNDTASFEYSHPTVPPSYNPSSSATTYFGPSNRNDTNNEWGMVLSKDSEKTGREKEDEDMAKAMKESMTDSQNWGPADGTGSDSGWRASVQGFSNDTFAVERLKGAPAIVYPLHTTISLTRGETLLLHILTSLIHIPSFGIFLTSLQYPDKLSGILRSIYESSLFPSIVTKEPSSPSSVRVEDGELDMTEAGGADDGKMKAQLVSLVCLSDEDWHDLLGLAGAKGVMYENIGYSAQEIWDRLASSVIAESLNSLNELTSRKMQQSALRERQKANHPELVGEDDSDSGDESEDVDPKTAKVLRRLGCGSAELPLEANPEAVQAVNITVSPQTGTSVHDAIEKLLWPSGDGVRVFWTTAEIVALALQYPDRVEGVRTPWKLEESFYVDRYMNSNLANVVQKRANAGLLRGEEQNMKATKESLVMHEGKRVRTSLETAIEYFSEVISLEGKTEAEKEKIQKTRAKLQKMLVELDNQVDSLTSQIIKNQKDQRNLFNDPELLQRKYNLQSVIFFNGLPHAPPSTTMYSYHRSSSSSTSPPEWFKVADTAVTSVTQEEVFSDHTGLHMGAGACLAIYAKDESWPDNEDDEDELDSLLAALAQQAQQNQQPVVDEPASNGPEDVEMASSNVTPVLEQSSLMETNEEPTRQQVEVNETDLSTIEPVSGYILSSLGPEHEASGADGQIGGKPPWSKNMNPLTAAQVACELCAQPMTFLLKVNTPESFVEHRPAFYVFVCANDLCPSYPDRPYKVWRHTSLPSKPAEAAADESDEVSLIPPGQEALCPVCTLRSTAEWSCPRCEVTYCSDEHQTADWRNHSDNCRGIAQSRRTDGKIHKRSSSVGSGWKVGDGAPKYGWGEGMDIQLQPTEKIRNALGTNHWQLLRYASRPMATKFQHDKFADPANCEKCGNERAFLFQVLPSVCSALECTEIKFGTLLIYACPYCTKELGSEWNPEIITCLNTT